MRHGETSIKYKFYLRERKIQRKRKRRNKRTSVKRNKRVVEVVVALVLRVSLLAYISGSHCCEYEDLFL
jgi:hypothetical protein